MRAPSTAQRSQRTAIQYKRTPRTRVDTSNISKPQGTTVTSIHSACKSERKKFMAVRCGACAYAPLPMSVSTNAARSACD